MSRVHSLNNREQYYRSQMEAFKSVDLAAQAPALGLGPAVDGRVSIRFFGRDYLASAGAIESADGRPVPFDHQSVMAHYLMSRGRGELKGEFLPIGRLTGILSSGASPSEQLIRPLAENFGQNYQLFKEAAQAVGGRYEGRAPSGGEAWLFVPLPYLPLKIVFFEADEEFEAEIKVLFDASAPVFVVYECLELMEMVLVRELLSAAGLWGCGACGSHGEGGCSSGQGCGD